MGSLVVKLDGQTKERLDGRFHYSDVDVLGDNGGNHPEGDGTRLEVLPMAYDVQAVKMSVRNILMWRVGESVLRPEFGHNLHRSMYSQMTQFNQDQVGQEIKRALEDNEPRIQVGNVSVQPDENGALKVRVKYVVVGSDKVDGAKIEQEEDVVVYGK